MLVIRWGERIKNLLVAHTEGASDRLEDPWRTLRDLDVERAFLVDLVDAFFLMFSHELEWRKHSDVLLLLDLLKLIHAGLGRG